MVHTGRIRLTILAVCSADGIALDPLIIFKGKIIQSTWYGEKALPETHYGASESGWMTTTIFHQWFQKFVVETKETRPLLLLFGGHMTHMWLETIEPAVGKDVSIGKLQLTALIYSSHLMLPVSAH